MSRYAEPPRVNKNPPEEAKSGTCNICYRNPHIGQIDRFQAVRAVARGLNEVELKVIIELAELAVNNPDFCCSVSSRELAKTTGCARSSVKEALEALIAKCIIASRTGGPKSATVYMANFLKTFIFASYSGGPEFGPPPINVDLKVDRNSVHPPVPRIPEGGPEFGPGGPEFGPPLNPEPIDSAQSGTLAKNVLFDRLEVSTNREVFDRTRARGITPVENPVQDALFDGSVRLVDAFKDRGAENPIESMLKANPKRFSRAEIDLAKRWMYSLAMKLRREKPKEAPDDKIVAQFLGIAPWPRLLAFLNDIQIERLEVGYSYGWYLTVALQRIYGIEWSPARQRAAEREAAQLRVVSRPEPPPPAPPEPLVQSGLDFPAPDIDPAEGRDFAADLLDKLKRAKSGFK
jgi:hypothetical protein